MSIPSPVLVAGADTGLVGRIGSNFRQLGHLEIKSSRGPTNSFSLPNSRRQYSQNKKCFLRILSSEKLNFVSDNKLAGLAVGKDAQNIDEDTDGMYEDLFSKYGKVVFETEGQKSPTAEVDDDAESLSFAVALAKVASDVKAADIRVLFVKPLVYWTRFFIITTAFSLPQVDAIGSRIRDLAEKKYGKIPTGDAKPKSWTLLDFGDVVVHIFLPQQRAFYNLEEFYGNAPLIELPSEKKPPPFRG